MLLIFDQRNKGQLPNLFTTLRSAVGRIKFKRRFAILWWVVFLLPYCIQFGWAQKKNKIIIKSKGLAYDSIRVESGKLIITLDTLFIVHKDTTLQIPQDRTIVIRNNPYAYSEEFYDSLKTKAYRHKVTRELYKLFVRRTKTQLSDTLNWVRSEASYHPFADKTIGSISYKKIDILEGSVLDTMLIAETALGKIANRLHTNTRNTAIRNNLLFRAGDKLSPTTLADNERLLRSLSFIQDARILVLPRLDNEDIVDIIVITQDRFWMQLDGSMSSKNNYYGKIGNRNFLGFGKEFSLTYHYNKQESPVSGFQIGYRDRNLGRSFIDLKLDYANYWRRKGIEGTLNREFVTPKTKWAGGVGVGETEEIKFDSDSDDSESRINYRRNFQDFWVGRSFQLRGPESRRNVSVTARIFNEAFTERPYVDADSNSYFQNDLLLIGGISFTRWDFRKSNLILGFGVTEDIPIGYLFEVDYGYEFGEFRNRPYTGFRLGTARFLPNLGYFQVLSGLGGFWRNKKLQEGTFDTDGIYFSPLVRLKQWKYRQFISARYTLGLDRKEVRWILMDELIRGVEDEKGDRRFAINVESVFFYSLNLYRFKIANYLFFDLGWITKEGMLLKSDNLFSSVGIGMRLGSENLIFRSIQLRLGYLLKGPAQNDSFNLNFSLRNPQLFRDLRTSKPERIKFE